MFNEDLEVDNESTREKNNVSVKEKESKSESSPSKKVNSFFKKNRSKDSKADEPPTSAVIPTKPVAVSPPQHEILCVDTTNKEESVEKETSDGDTHTTGSSSSGIEAERASPIQSGWVVDDEDDFANDNIEIKESRCGDCGCSQTIHDQLLCIGGLIFKIVGKPNDKLRATMEEAGDLFAEEESLDGSEY
jgi:hypothetical protein